MNRSSDSDALEKKLREKSAIVGVVGLGYVGVPLAIAFAKAGFKVIGFDIQQEKVDSINSGRSYIGDVSDEEISSARERAFLEATVDQGRLREVDAVCICVPTPLTRTKDPDLSHIIYESERISQFLSKGQLVILESTTYPGTTREVVMPILERSGLTAGKDFFLAYSPERVDPSSRHFNLKNTPKLVGGIDPKSTSLAAALYRHVADKVLEVSSPDVAEMSKVFENVFRIVNIALVNELAQLCERMGISVWEVIDLAATKPFGYMPFYPGPGVGGHCIPLDPYYLASTARKYDFHTRFIELAAEINEKAPYYVTTRIVESLNAKGKSIKGAKVLVLGVAYKKNAADTRESPSLKLIGLLLRKGASVSFNDPYISEITMDGELISSQELSDEVLSGTDCLVIATDHDVYDINHIVKKSSLVFDSRGATKGLDGDNIVRLGE